MAWVSLVAGGFAGLCTDISLYPLDTLKTRLQASVGFRKAGGFHGIYKGLPSAMVGSVPSAALFWCTYDTCKRAGVTASQRLGSNHSESWVHMAAACTAETAACVVRVPVDNVKQKMQAHLFHTIQDTCRGIWAADGARGFYVGTLSTVARDLPFAVIQFPLYEQFKRAWSRHCGVEVAQLESSKAAMCGSMAGAVAATLTTPMDVVKTRMMLGGDSRGVRYRGVLDVVHRVCAEEGPGRLFAGVAPRVMWISLGGFVFFGSCEKCKKVLQGL